MSPNSARQATTEGSQTGWRDVRHYAYVQRPYEAVWSMLVEAPRDVFGGAGPSDREAAMARLRVHGAGLEVSRPVKITFGGIVVEEDMARMGLRWEDGRHPLFFPVLSGIFSVAPVKAGRRHTTQIGLVGRYRPPFGALGAFGDRMAGEDVVAASVAGFVDDVARRLEALVEAGAPAPEAEDPAAGWDSDDGDRRRVLVPVDGLGERRGGAVGVGRQLAGTPGVVHAQVDPLSGMAEIEYDPELCSLTRILAELEVDPPPPASQDPPA